MMVVSKPLTAIIRYEIHRHVTENFDAHLNRCLCLVFNNDIWREGNSDVLIIPGCQGNAIDPSRRVYIIHLRRACVYEHPASGPQTIHLWRSQYSNTILLNRIKNE